MASFFQRFKEEFIRQTPTFQKAARHVFGARRLDAAGAGRAPDRRRTRRANRPLALVYGAGIGIRSIVKGTLPLALFGPHGYAALMGRLALPQLLVAALAPLAAAWLLEAAGPTALLWALVGVTALDAVFVGLIRVQMRGR